MNRILLLISLIILVSCGNNKKETSSGSKQESIPTEQVKTDSVPDVDEGVTVLHPGGEELELGVSEGGGYMD